jgi:hypothetical protein
VFGRQPHPKEAHVELSVPPALYESLQEEGIDISEYIPSLLGAILSAAVGAGRGHGGKVEISFSV